MKILIRTKDIARVFLVEKRSASTYDTHRLCITYENGSTSEWRANCVESPSQHYVSEQIKNAYMEITKACKEEKEFVEFEID